MPQPRSHAPLLALLLSAAACGNGTTEPDREIKENPSFSADIMEIVNRKGCNASSCHGGGAGEMTLGDAATTYAAWVGEPAACLSTGGCDPEEVRVIPADAQNSYVVKKIEGRQTVGARMPLTGAFLDAIDVANLRNWIDNGAPNN